MSEICTSVSGKITCGDACQMLQEAALIDMYFGILFTTTYLITEEILF